MYKIGRNEPCPCGSGRKYKHCCALDPASSEEIYRAASHATSRDELLTQLNRPIQIYSLRVTLESIRSREPADTISRTIEIEDGDTLYDLHCEIQHAFHWDNDHLYSFYMSNEVGDMQSEYAGDPMGGDVDSALFRAPRSAAQTELRNLGLKQGDQFKYLFDYGDDLIHTVEVFNIQDRTIEDVKYPRVVEKIGEPPPQYDYIEE